MGQEQMEITLRDFVEATAISEGEALAYAMWWWWERQKGTPQRWTRQRVRLWDMVVSELAANVFHVHVTPAPSLVYSDPCEFKGVTMVKGWIFRYEGGGTWTLVVSSERDGWDAYKRIYHELKGSG